jgi:hypothetical protein
MDNMMLAVFFVCHIPLTLTISADERGENSGYQIRVLIDKFWFFCYSILYRRQSGNRTGQKAIQGEVKK